ncbi:MULTISPECIES: hemerythrin domain-containing protein [unclassified Streptomyces]|uniref:hemerythrin domain-containing protein n=1 Tax=unclassified Streptomyces TaxID=2593676 RepID=UPI002DD994C3|nr:MULTISPECIES: hemerythrin domain-containing protein [unclassified Streptomyces]WSA95818.1 hemerythrin domain-containing protein [Streptomyces sp. NBC_01795]WSB80237.1 hemerythrin domain-containing protein [Streptomyces sp. NBC_01775]WSS11555.1 hemerythrin domain-containing protein [Streptomyces sp. NBC_01186]WSS40270.1 hemerythrin domain-containing protein [Streptomyces sp. NBC_01187]
MAHKQDVLELLMDDHRECERLFAAYEATGDPERRRLLAEQLVAGLVRHAAAEERRLHPVIRRRLSGGDRLVDAALARRAEVERTLEALEGADPRSPAFDRDMSALMNWIQEHVATEEGEVFPRLHAALSHRERLELGAGAREAKRQALDPGPGVVDRVRDWLTTKA